MSSWISWNIPQSEGGHWQAGGLEREAKCERIGWGELEEPDEERGRAEQQWAGEGHSCQCQQHRHCIVQIWGDHHWWVWDITNWCNDGVYSCDRNIVLKCYLFEPSNRQQVPSCGRPSPPWRYRNTPGQVPLCEVSLAQVSASDKQHRNFAKVGFLRLLQRWKLWKSRKMARLKGDFF